MPYNGTAELKTAELSNCGLPNYFRLLFRSLSL